MDVWSEEWDENQAEGRRRRVAAGETLGATLYELSRGGGIAYHFHHGTESCSSSFAVASRFGRLARALPHGVDARLPNATEYPDTQQLAVTARTKNQFGEELSEIRTLSDPESR